MELIYVTELCRFLTKTGHNMKRLDGVRATVSDKPLDVFAEQTVYKPEEWCELLKRPGVVYRYKRGEYAKIN